MMFSGWIVLQIMFIFIAMYKTELCLCDNDCTQHFVKLTIFFSVSTLGSSALPYTLKKFNGGYSCTCQGWIMQINVKGERCVMLVVVEMMHNK